VKLTDLHPCDNCGGRVDPIFFVVRVSQALVMPGARGEAESMFGDGQAPTSSLWRNSEDAVLVFGSGRAANNTSNMYTEALVCADCFHSGRATLPRLVERLGRADELAIDQADGGAPR